MKSAFKYLFVLTGVSAISIAATYLTVKSKENNSIQSNTKTGEQIWVGESFSSRVTDLQYATMYINYRGTFWFTVNSSGNLSGEAQVIYDIRLDDSKLRCFIVFFNTMKSSIYSLYSLGEISVFTQALGIQNSMKDATGIQGMSVAYDEGMPVRIGKITGTIDNRSIHIEWAGAPQKMGYQTYTEYLNKNVSIKSGNAPSYSPWFSDAKISNSSGDNFAFSKPENSMKEFKQSKDYTIWSAHRIK